MTSQQRTDIASLDLTSAIGQRLLAKLNAGTLQAVVSRPGQRLDPKIAAIVQHELATRRQMERRQAFAYNNR